MYTHRRDDSGLDVVPGTLGSEGLGEAYETHLGSAVICLTKVACTNDQSYILFVQKDTAYRRDPRRSPCSQSDRTFVSGRWAMRLLRTSTSP